MRSARKLRAATGALLLVWIGTSQTARAAEATADWPCIQPRQPHLSLGQMWSGPPPTPQAEALARNDPAIAALAETLALRRVPIADAGAMIAAFAADGDADRSVGLMLATLTRVDGQRTAILDGIARYGGGQSALARHIAERRSTLDALSQGAKPDFDMIDAEEEKLDWDQRIFEERRQMLTAVCESPVLMEKRLFEIARLIAAAKPAGTKVPDGPAGKAGTGIGGVQPANGTTADDDVPAAKGSVTPTPAP